MSKWLHLLQECEKNKNIENQPMSAMSASNDKNNDQKNDIKNKIKNQKEYLYRPADIADIGSIPSKEPEVLDFPTLWSNAIEITLTRNKPKEISESRWSTIIQRLDVLIHAEKPHLLKMIEYGWSTEEIFGCHQFAPDLRIDGMGLLMLMTNAAIAEIKPKVAFLKHKDGAVTTYYLGMLNHHSQEQSTLMEVV